MIYFLQPTDGGPVKIGHSSDVAARARQLEAYYGRPLAILATMDGDRDREREIHARSAHLRFGRTEQFRPGPDLMAFIGRPLLVDANPDAVEALDPENPQIPVISLKGSAEMKDWLKRFSKETHYPAATLVRLGLASEAKRLGFESPPEK